MSLANPINAPAGGLKPECWKRKGSEGEDEDLTSNAKRAKYSWYVMLESESPQATSSDEDDESIHSVQGVETEFAHDTEDTSTHTWVTSSDNTDVSIHEEFDPVSASEDENPFVDDSSSDPEELIRVGVIAALARAACDSDVGLADDSDDSRTSRDSEISLADYWTCFQCNTSNNNPKFRYCDKCYTERKNHLPLRPKGKKQRRKLAKLAAAQRETPKDQAMTIFDSDLGSSQESQRSISFDIKRIDIERNSQSQSLKELEVTTFDSGLGSSQESQRSISFDINRIDIERNSQSQSLKELEVTGFDSSQENQRSISFDLKRIDVESNSQSQSLKELEVTGFDSSQESQRSISFDMKRTGIENNSQSQSFNELEITGFDSSQESQRSISFDIKRIDVESNSHSQSLNEHELTGFDSGLGSSQGSQQSLSLDFKRIDIESPSGLRVAYSQSSLPSSQESIDTVDMGLSSSQPSTSFQSQSNSQEMLTMDSRNSENRISEKSIEETEFLRPASQESARSVASTASIGSRDLNNWDSSDESGSIEKIVVSTKRVQYQIDPENKLCLICTVAPKNGVFVHGRITHICCCYRCAKRVWKTTKHCPICNRKVRDVLKAYYA